MATASLVAAALIGASATTAAAIDDPTDATADLIQRAAPDQGEVVDGVAQDRQVVTDAERAKATIPFDADQPVTLQSSGAGEANAGIYSLRVGLPSEVTARDGQVADDGTVVYHSVDGGADAAVQSLDDGTVRIQTITPDSDGPRKFTYTFGDDITPVLDDDGTVELRREIADGVMMTIGTVDRPWAVDADGAAVSTTYAVKGNALIQTIEPTSATQFPVVADPRFGFSYGVIPTAFFSKSETRRARDAGPAYILCGAVGTWNAAAGILCSSNIYIVTAGAKQAVKRGGCLKLVLNPVGVSQFTYYKGCK